MRFLVGAFAIVLLTRCVTLPYQPQAREVKRRPTAGGTIALNTTYRPEDRAHAEIVMKSNCGNQDVKIVEEGEVVVGEYAEAATDKDARTSTNTFTLGDLTFANEKPREHTTTQTVQLKEWHITYDCIASAGPNSENVAKRKKKTK